MSILGVNISGDVAWLALVDGADVMPKPDRFELPKQPRPMALRVAIDELKLLFIHHSVDVVVVLDAHGNAQPRSFQSCRPRFVLEVLLELAAMDASITYRLIAPKTVQSLLSLPSSRIADHADKVCDRAGVRWQHRGPAAVVALAIGKETDDAS